jgi:hypothetical protein
VVTLRCTVVRNWTCVWGSVRLLVRGVYVGIRCTKDLIFRG